MLIEQLTELLKVGVILTISVFIFMFIFNGFIQPDTPKVKRFRLQHLIYDQDGEGLIVNEKTAPTWLTSQFIWSDIVLTLAIGEYFETDFYKIVRLS